jgi:hypothetical protein
MNEDVETTVPLENGPGDLVSTIRGTDICPNEEIESIAVRTFGARGGCHSGARGNKPRHDRGAHAMCAPCDESAPPGEFHRVDRKTG